MKTLNIRTIPASLWDTPNFVRIRAHDVIHSYRQFSSNSQQRPVSNLLTNNQPKLFSIRKLLISSKTAAGPIQFNNKQRSLLLSNQSPNYFLKLFTANRVFSKFIFSYYTAADVYSLFGRVVNRNFACDKTYRIVARNKSSFRCPSKQILSVTLNMGWPTEYDNIEPAKVLESRK